MNSQDTYKTEESTRPGGTKADRGSLYGIKGEDGPYQKAILFAMNRLRMPIYSGTVEPEEIARRRKANKVARISRRKNRK